MVQAMTAVAHLPKAAPRHCTCSKVHKPAARRATTGRASRLQCNSSGNSEHSEVVGTSDQGQEATAPQQQERFVSVSDLLAEVKDLGDDFVFEDNEEGDVWGHEQRLKAQSLSGFQETTVDNVYEALQQSQTGEPLLLDVRTPQEYRSGHATTAVNIELDALSEAVRAGTLDDWKDQGSVLVICQSGKRSAQATVRLSKVFGFQQVINVKGGTSAWVAAGYPTEQGDGMTMDAPPHLL